MTSVIFIKSDSTICTPDIFDSIWDQKGFVDCDHDITGLPIEGLTSNIEGTQKCKSANYYYTERNFCVSKRKFPSNLVEAHQDSFLFILTETERTIRFCTEKESHKVNGLGCFRIPYDRLDDFRVSVNARKIGNDRIIMVFMYVNKQKDVEDVKDIKDEDIYEEHEDIDEIVTEHELSDNMVDIMESRKLRKQTKTRKTRNNISVCLRIRVGNNVDVILDLEDILL